jgi:hypothetical protein
MKSMKYMIHSVKTNKMMKLPTKSNMKNLLINLRLQKKKKIRKSKKKSLHLLKVQAALNHLTLLRRNLELRNKKKNVKTNKFNK